MSKSRSEKSLVGVWSALATPFTKDGALAFSDLEKILTKQIEAGLAGVVIGGSTGEGPTLSAAELLELCAFTKDFVKGRCLVMAGAGGSDSKTTVERALALEEAGVDLLLVATPPYNKPSRLGLLEHYRLLTRAVSIPIGLYHVPSRTSQRLSPELLLEICRIPGVDFVKEASGDINFLSDCMSELRIPLFSGDDPSYLPTLTLGAAGVISVASNLMPKAMQALTQAFWAKDLDRARQLHFALHPLFGALGIESNPGPLKAAMSLYGLCENNLRLPLSAVTDENFARIKTAVALTEKKLSALGLPSER